MKIKAIKTRIFKESEKLLPFLNDNLPIIKENTVVIITSKILALSEGRVVDIKDDYTREKVIKSESQWAMKTKYIWLTIKDNMVMPSAGIDESNANGKIILLPKNSFKSAAKIRNELRGIYNVKNLGVIITDSRSLPLRAGIVGVALGYSGFGGIRDYRGKADIFGRILKSSKTDVADSLATAAVLVMGEGDERKPLAIITDAPIEFKDRINNSELEIDIKEDLYIPLFKKIENIKWKKKK